MFRWRYHTVGNKLELYDYTNLSKVLKAECNIRICTRYFDCGLWLPFSYFVIMVLNHFRRALTQYATHFYLFFIILEDINNTIGYGPLSMDDIRSYFYVKCTRVRYIIFKRSYKNHICLFPNKLRYENSDAYEVNDKYHDGTIPLYHTSPNFGYNLVYILGFI